MLCLPLRKKTLDLGDRKERSPGGAVRVEKSPFAKPPDCNLVKAEGGGGFGCGERQTLDALARCLWLREWFHAF